MSVRLSGPPRRASAGAAPGIDRPRLRRRAARCLDALCHRASELSVALVDDATIASLNRSWRGVEGPTDVLAFPQQEVEPADGTLLGDVIIGIDTAARQARRRRTSLDDELARLLIHGLLHLVGHDHARRAEARAMRAEERRLWRAAGR